MRQRFLFAALLSQLAAGCAGTVSEPATQVAPLPAASSSQPSSGELAPAETPDEAFRKQPPPGGPEGRFAAPIPIETTLPNGVRVLFLESHASPIVSIQVIASRGAEQAPAGVGGFAGAMLLMGTKTRSAAQTSDALEALGASYGAAVDFDSAGASATVMAGDAPRALAVLADIMQNAVYPDDDLERLRARRLASLAEESDDSRAVLRNAIAEVLYPPGHPYRASLLGSEEAIRRIKRADLVAFHKANIQPDTTTVAVAGAIEKQALMEAVQESFGAWKGRAARATVPRDPAVTASKQPRVVLVDRPGATLTQVAVTTIGSSRTAKEHDALMALGTVLTRRLNSNLREQRGLTYGVTAGVSFRKGAGPLVAGGPVVRERTAEAVEAILSELARLRAAPIPPNELTDIRSILSALSARFETAQSSTSALAPLAIFGLPTDEYMTRRVRLQLVSREVLQKTAETFLKPERLQVVLVGDANVIEQSVRKLGLGEVEIRRQRPRPTSSEALVPALVPDLGDEGLLARTRNHPDPHPPSDRRMHGPSF